MRNKKPKQKVGKLPANAMKARVLRQSVTVFGMKALKLYADEVNLDRATPDLQDGLKPVQRRILYAASDIAKTSVVKTARLVGEVMGKYHPHGDASISDACTKMVQACTPLMYGSGNWGNILEPAAAMRYTEIRMSYFGRTGFDPDYANKEVTSFVPTYDDKLLEPVAIPFPLPVILFNGGSGIGYGAACNIPAFTPDSVVEVLKRLLGGEKLKPEDFAKTMKPASKWGGQFVNTKINRLAWLQMFRTNKASVQFESPLVIDTAKKTIIINEWPDGLSPTAFTDWVRNLPETQECYTSKGSSEFTIQMKKGYNSVQFDAYSKKLAAKTRVKSSFNINVTSRKAIVTDGVVDYEVALLSLSVPQLVIAWLRSRIETEVRSLEYRIRKQNGLIAYSKLLIFAASKIDVIMPIIKKSAKPREDLAKALKITGEQADQILDLTLRKLTRLDQNELRLKLKDQESHLVQLGKWLKAPKRKVANDIDLAMQEIKRDREVVTKVKTQKLVMK